jgi:DNA-binding NtrC family response regulator
MPRRPKPAGRLARLLEASQQPIYVLDEQREILFCNTACAAWAGTTSEALIGQTCNYHSAAEANDPAAVAARLCPPPDVFSGGIRRGQVASLDTAGQLILRAAEFVPLSAERAGALLVIVSPADLPPSPAGAPVSVELAPAELHAELQRLRRQFAGRYALDRLFGPSPSSVKVRAQVQLAAAAPASVLVVGPPGSGKIHVAKAIHYRQPAGKLPGLLPIACAALDPELLVSTLGAQLARSEAGREDSFGTLLLQDVDALPLEIQPQLLQMLRPVRALRLIATACRAPADLVAESQFSGELAALLSTLTIELVPLVDRIDDLPLLAQAFLEDLNATGDAQIGGFSPEALDLLAGYHWPGNLDELAAMVRDSHNRAARIRGGDQKGPGTEITPRDLPERIHLAAAAARWPRREEEPIDLDEVLGRLEAELINRALGQAKGNKSRAAELLGLTRPRFYRRLIQLGLAGEDAADEIVEFEELE